MTIWQQAEITPDKPAMVMHPSGESITFGELADRTLRLASLIRAAGLGTGDALAVWMRNSTWYHSLYFAAMRCGVYFVPVNANLTASEAAYIIDDADVSLVFAHPATAGGGELRDLVNPGTTLISIGAEVPGFHRVEPRLAGLSHQRDDDVVRGATMFYSSGTTGRPKGIKRTLSGVGYEEGNVFETFLQSSYGMTDDTTFLSPGPSYHSLSLMYAAGTLDAGGTVVFMERFDAAAALDLMERHRITMSQWVPTMHKRLLALPAELRTGRDFGAHTLALVAGAPCPPQVKQQMIDWWGPIVTELYGASEPYGITRATAQEWLAHPGTVGKALMGVPHICDPDGTELPAGAAGRIYFDLPERLEYHKDPDKSVQNTHRHHPTWRTVGDIGYLDDEGFLYVTDRESNVIISGGVNIYPQEIEDALISDPDVHDAAIIGVPDDDLGEIARAVVVLCAGVSEEGKRERLIETLGRDFAKYKIPREWVFVGELPRHDNGKLYKRLLATLEVAP
ncbi:AMP-binding protein [Nocardia sp. NPDC050799]|uniref:AMP-binding protein n=1 Tax=Nocardia sp. NPDC050799 TaxID=3154842 RepID=UPI0033DF3F67